MIATTYTVIDEYLPHVSLVKAFELFSGTTGEPTVGFATVSWETRVQMAGRALGKSASLMREIAPAPDPRNRAERRADQAKRRKAARRCP